MPYVIVGAGGFGKEVYQYLLDLGAARPADPVAGVLDDRRSEVAWGAGKVPLLGTTTAYTLQPADRFVIAIGDPAARQAVAERLIARGGHLASLVHPRAYVAPTAELGPGCLIAPFAFVGPDARLGCNVALNVFALVGHDARVGDHAVLCPYAAVNGAVILEERVFLGTHATIAPGRRIGAGSKVAAGAVVSVDVGANALAAGNPARARELFSDPTSAP